MSDGRVLSSVTDLCFVAAEFVKQTVFRLSKELTDSVVDLRHSDAKQLGCQAAVECRFTFAKAGYWSFENRLIRKLWTIEVGHFGKSFSKLKRVDSL